MKLKLWGNNMNKMARILIAAISIATLHGCATVVGPIHAYEGGPKGKESIAKLVATTIPGTTLKYEEQSLFCGVDGRKFEKPTRELYLLPGEHELCVRYSVPAGGFIADMGSRRFDKELSINVEAGQKYELKLQTGVLSLQVDYLLIDSNEKVVASTKQKGS